MTTDRQAARPIEILQLTDLHLVAEPNARLWNLDTYETFRSVLTAAIQRYPTADLLLLTGDLAHHGERLAYHRLRDCLSALDYPVYCIPGNHDDTEHLGQTLESNNLKADRTLRLNGWQLILLDSNAPSAKGGRLDENERLHLEQHLATHPDRHALIALHHQPVPIESPWMDAMGLENSAELFSVLDRHPQVRGILWGHIHQVFESARAGVQLLGAPSTCVQFKPRATAFAEDDLGPGYRWLRLHADGKIETKVHYLER